MISDSERREVAARLRNEAKYMRYKQDWYEEDADLCECGNRAYRNIADSVIPGNNFNSDYILIVERLADLIDRPKTHVDVDGHGRACCAVCGCDDWCLADGSRYCPNCGAEVVRDG